MSIKKEMGREIFTIKGILDEGQKVGLFKKWPYEFIAYQNGLFIRCNGKGSYIKIEDIDHIFRKDNVNDKVPRRQLVIYYYEKGESMKYTLMEDTYPNIIEYMESIYKHEWINYSRNYSESLKWFTTAIAHWLIAVERPHDIFGPPGNDIIYEEDDKEILNKEWEIYSHDELMERCESLISCPSIQEAKDYYEDSSEDVYDEEMPPEMVKIRIPIMRDYERTMKAFDLFRVIMLANFGYTAGYISYEESMDWCLEAGKELQKTYRSWDDYIENYLLGYCFTFEVDDDDEGTYAHMRKKAYYETKKYSTHPWQISWNIRLTKEW